MSETAVEIPVFDPTAIDKIREMAGDKASEFVTEMVQLFLEEGDKAVSHLRAASEAGDWKAVSRAAHSLKSSSATLGLMLLSQACKSLELDTKNGASGPASKSLAADVFTRYEQTVPILKSLL